MANEKNNVPEVEIVTTPEVEVNEPDFVNPFEESCTKCVADVYAKLELVREALKDKDLDKYGERKTALNKAVDDCNKLLRKRQYAEFVRAENPMIAAVEAFYVELYKVKEEKGKDSEKVVGINLEKKNARIDLEKFCEICELDKTWAIDSGKLLALLSAREVDVYAIKPADLAKKSFYFASVVRKKKEGETPDSNTQIVKLLQKIIDEAIFVDNGEGKNKYKCDNHDIAFIQDAVTKMDTKEKCTISMLNERQFKNVMMSVFAHCLGEAYKVKPAKVKANA